MDNVADADMADESALQPPGSASVTVVDAEADEDSVTKLVRTFERDNLIPDVIKKKIDEFDNYRKYVHTDAMMPTDPNGVSTNYLLRFQWIHMSQIYARDPRVLIRPKRKVGVYPPEVSAILEAYAKTMEVLVDYCAQEANLRAQYQANIQDTDTVGIAFFKMAWCEDTGRDPIGNTREPSMVALMDEAKYLATRIADGKDEDGEKARLESVLDTLRKNAEAEQWRQVAYPGDTRKARLDGQPTPAEPTKIGKYVGFQSDSIMPEDLRWDWKIVDPLLFHRADWIQHRVYMTEAAIREQFGIPEGENLRESGTEHAVDTTKNERPSDPADRSGVESAVRGNRLAVWERWDRKLGKVFVWVEGAKKFLKEYIPPVVTSRFYPFFCLFFNRATGRFLPVSMVEMSRDLQDEINIVRTHKRAGKRAAYDRFVVESDFLEEAAKDELRTCKPGALVETNKAIAGGALKDKIFQINGQYKPELYEIVDERQELASMAGIPNSAQFMTRDSADTATEAAQANQSSEAMADMHRALLERSLQEVFIYMAEVLAQALPEENAKAIAGPEALWPLVDRESLWKHLQLDIEAGSTGKPDQRRQLENFTLLLDTANKVGIGQPGGPQLDPIKVMRKLADIIDWREDPADLVLPPAPMLNPVVAPGDTPSQQGILPNNTPGVPSGPVQPNAVPSSPVANGAIPGPMPGNRPEPTP